MKKCYLKFQERLFSDKAKALFTEANVKPVASIDFFKQQYLVQEEFDLMVLPAVYVDYEINHDPDKKSSDVVITLHLCYETLRDTTGRKKMTANNALKFFDYVDIVYELVKDLQTDETGKMELTGENQEKNDAIIYTHLLIFKASYHGRFELAKNQYNFTEGDSNLDVDGDNSGLVQRFTDNL